ncbi:MAG TPA: hypothetical protein VGQ36_08795 [Thermoanaerobaculia bacterium]|jgi:hypothetical protein|nr:hypothetical protein [Thermoanaerobaculia bacterium]
MARKVPFVTLTERETVMVTAINVLQVETFERHKGGTAITFASGTTMEVLERFDSVLKKMQGGAERRRT